MTESMMGHALAYAAAGLPVLPLLPGRKEPACPHGKDDATPDTEQITRWWTARPECNIGVRPPVGIVVLDVDTQHGGPAELAKLTARFGPLPDTWTARTGQGGQHIWLRADGPFRGKLCPGVDLKTHTGYLVVPPSVHPNGNTYQWLNRQPIHYAPAWLRPLLSPPAPTVTRRAFGWLYGGAGSALVAAVAQAPTGQRNHMLFWAACRAINEGSYPALRRQLSDAATAAGLPGAEIENTLKSAEKKAVSSR